MHLASFGIRRGDFIAGDRAPGGNGSGGRDPGSYFGHHECSGGQQRRPEEPTVLSPFVVDAAEDQGSYKANSTLAGTRVRTDLNDISSALSVVTAQFLQDTGATNSQDLLVYTVNTEVGGINGNFSGQGGLPSYNEALINPSNTTRVRGLDSADNTRNYFLTDIPWDSFNSGRIDLQRGPNSILFGVGSPAGIINNSVNDAEFQNFYKVENRVGSYGSLRDSADLNYVLIKNTLAIRFSWVDDDELYQQRYAYNNSKRFYGALRYDPNFFGKDNHTSLRANFERGGVSANNPRALPPVDEITPWFATTNAYGNVPLNKLTVNEYMPGNDNSAGNPGYIAYIGGSWAQGRTYYPDVISYYNGGGATTTSSTPTQVIAGMIPTGYGVNSAGVVSGTIAGLPFYRPDGVPPFSLYAANAAVPVPGGAFYADKVITDPSIFNFYDNLLDGPNKLEWQNWSAANVALSQTFFNDRLGFEVVYDRQKYVSGEDSFLQGENYAIGIDVNDTYSNGAANPDVGRPYVANSFWTGADASTIERSSLRFTTTGDLNSADFFGKNLVTEILGRSVLTGLLEEDRKDTDSLQWNQYGADENLPSLFNVPVDTLTSNRQYDWVDYIGPSLMGASSASGANLQPITNVIAPSSQSTFSYFNSHWNAPSVNPGAPYSYVSPATGQMVTTTQSDNPANYVGWTSATVNWLNANNPQQFPDLVTGAQKFRYTDISEGITWQGYFFDGDLVGTFGWRKDSVVNRQGSGSSNPVSGLVSTDFSVDPDSRTEAVGESKTWGGVYHLPKRWTNAIPIPGGLSVSAFYDRSSNFKADAPRQNLFGDTIPNPNGQTKEYGFILGALNDRLTLKVDWYRTVEQFATLDSTNGNSIAGLGSNGYFMWAAPDWGLGYAAQLQDGLEGINHNADWNYALADGVPGAGAGPGSPAFDNAPETAVSKAVVQAWLNIPLPASFFNYYGIHPLPIDPALGKASGEIRSDFGPGYTENISIGSEEWSGTSNAVSTTNTLSKGTELELSGQLTKNWNLTLNYSRTFATHEDVDPTTAAFMSSMYTFFTGPAGQLRLWGPGATPIGPQWVANVYDPYLVEVHTEGLSAPEVAPWRFNVITSYTFDRGPLKGLLIGGADRLEAGRILGYPYSPALGFLDVVHPYIGSNEQYFDAWIGYSRRIFNNRVRWQIQLNSRNLFQKSHLQPDSIEPDGSLALERIQEGMTWQLSNSFEY